MPTLPTDPSAASSGEVATVSPVRRAAVVVAARTWSGQLIDLGGRNTLLHYRDLRAGTLDLASAETSAVARLLSGRAVRLSVLFPGDLLADAARRMRTVAAKARENFEERGLSIGYTGLHRARRPARTGDCAGRCRQLASLM